MQSHFSSKRKSFHALVPPVDRFATQDVLNLSEAG